MNIAPFIASAGVIGLAIGFGAQNLVRDFVTGVFMLLEDQYGVGDFVDLGEMIGEVQSVGLRITTLRDIDGTLWYVRNGEIARVGNMSQEYAVARIEVPVALTADVEEAEQVALRRPGGPSRTCDRAEGARRARDARGAGTLAGPAHAADDAEDSSKAPSGRCSGGFGGRSCAPTTRTASSCRIRGDASTPW